MGYYLRQKGSNRYVSVFEVENGELKTIGFTAVDKNGELSEELEMLKAPLPKEFDKFFDITMLNKALGVELEWCCKNGKEYYSVNEMVTAFFNKPSSRIKKLFYKLFSR